MKCSLLTLSTYVDDELPTDRRAEVDAHLVGCGRCSAGAATLREERGRIGQLARVRVTSSSVRLMLEQLGITGAPDTPASRPLPPPREPAPDSAPWHSAKSSPALPWTPRRPEVPMPPTVAAAASPSSPAIPEVIPLPPRSQEIAVPPVTADAQPDLPFDAPAADRGSRSATVPTVDVESAAEVGRDDWPADPAPSADELLTGDAAVPQDGWEVDLPPPVMSRPVASAPAPPTIAAPTLTPVAPPAAPVAPALAPVAAAPTRVAPSGAAVLWSRMRDAVAVRMALARTGEAVDDSVDIVNGSAPRRGMQLPAAEAGTGGMAGGRTATLADQPRTGIATSPEPDDATPDGLSSVELTGVSDISRLAARTTSTEPQVATPPERSADTPSWVGDDADDAGAPDPGWHAFAASSYPDPDDVPADISPPVRAKPLGRHSRAAAGDGIDVAQRVRRATAAAMESLRGGGRSGATGVHAAIASGGRVANRDRRIIAAIAAVAVIFLTALVIGHGSTPPAASSTAGRVSPSTAPAHSSAPAASVSAGTAPAVVPPKASSSAPATSPAVALTFGAGATGFQISGLRYGQQPGYMRIVFDMGPVKGNNGTSPTVTVASSNATTLLVTFAGTLPAGSVGSVPAGSVISSVTLVSSSGGKSVYRIVVTHTVSASAEFLTGTSPPLRFVLDLH